MSRTRSSPPPTPRVSTPVLLAKRNAEDFAAAYRRLGVQPPDVEPAATDHIPEMLDLIAGADRQRATPTRPAATCTTRSAASTATASCRVAASTSCSPAPGSSRGSRSATRSTSPCGRRPSRASRPGTRRGDRAGPAGTSSARRWRAATWAIRSTSTPVATTSIFPHHENEIAQSEAATGKPFARYWLHNGMVTLRRRQDGEVDRPRGRPAGGAGHSGRRRRSASSTCAPTTASPSTSPRRRSMTPRAPWRGCGRSAAAPVTLVTRSRTPACSTPSGGDGQVDGTRRRPARGARHLAAPGGPAVLPAYPLPQAARVHPGGARRRHRLVGATVGVPTPGRRGG